MLNRTEETREQKSKARLNLKHLVVKATKPTEYKNKIPGPHLRTASSIYQGRGWLKQFYCRQIFTLGPDVFLIQNYIKSMAHIMAP